MKDLDSITLLSALIAVLSAIAAASGLFWKKGGSPFEFGTLHGRAVRISGRGLYRHDTVFFAAGFKGQDAVILFLAVPFLVASTVLFRRGSLIGHLLLAGMLGYFLYVYASMALGAAYNRLFLVYIILFALSLFGFICILSSVDLKAAVLHSSEGIPIRALAIFMFAAGLVTLAVWGAPLVSALVKGSPPEKMDSYTTMVTYALDLAVITPSAFICGVLVLRGAPFGYVMAFPLLAIAVLLAPQIILSALFQRSAGVAFSTGEYIGPMAGFAVLGAGAAWLLALVIRALEV
jgi:hypothetical protein